MFKLQRNFENTALVSRVIDGDTFDADVDVGFHIQTRQRFRIRGIDAPEKNQPGFLESTTALKNLIEGRTITIRSFKTDVFGRWLADVFLITATRTENIASYMVSKKFAKLYAGAALDGKLDEAKPTTIVPYIVETSPPPPAEGNYNA